MKKNTNNMVKKRDEIILTITNNQINIRQYGVKRLGLFGSTNKNGRKKNSDIDFLVEFKDGKKNFDNFMELSFYLEDLFNSKIDLLTTESLDSYLKNEIFKEVTFIEV